MRDKEVRSREIGSGMGGEREREGEGEEGEKGRKRDGFGGHWKFFRPMVHRI